MTETKSPGVNIGQIFAGEVRFAHRSDALALPPTTRHEVTDVQVTFEIREAEDKKSALLKARISTNPSDSNALYQFAIEVIAIANAVEGQESLAPAEFLKIAGIATLYPFLRELVANITMRGRFGPVWLNPINPRGLLDEGKTITSPAKSLPSGKKPKRIAPRGDSKQLKG